MFVTPHAKERLEGRLFGIVTLQDVMKAVTGISPQVGEQHVLVKRLPRTITIHEEQGDVMGDMVWAVVKRRTPTDKGSVVTIMLRGSYQPKRGL